MTNLAAYRNHLDPADASAPVASSLAPSDPPVVITLRSSRLNNSTTDSSSAFIGLNPGSPPLIKNGDFEEDEPNPPSPPSSGEFIGDLRKWHVGEPSPAKLAWRAIGGEKAVSPTDPNIPGERANYLQWETQQQIAEYTLPSRYDKTKTDKLKLNSYAELDAHWERKDANGTPIRGNTATDKKDAGKSDPSTESDHGIKQTISLSRGNYLLLFDYRGRFGSDSNQFKVSAKGERAVDVETDLIAEKDASDPITGESPTGLQKWKQGSVSFSVSGGNPADTAALPVILKFDLVLAPGKKADSFGVFIDNVILLPVELNCPELYMFSGHSGDKVELCKVAGIACEWKLKNANPVIGTFDHPTDSACSFTATAPGKNTIQLVVGGKVAWEKTTEILDLKSRATWGPEAVVLSEMSGVMRAPPTPPGTGTPITQIFNLTYHHSANAGDGVTEIQRIQRAHKAEGLPYSLPEALGGHEKWGDIGYHFVLTKDGTVYEARKLEAAPGSPGGPYTLGADVLKKNTWARIGLCMLGNYDTEVFSAAHQKDLEKVIAAICRRYKLKWNNVSYHSARAAAPTPWDSAVYQTTHCPGAHVQDKAQEISDHVRENLQ